MNYRNYLATALGTTVTVTDEMNFVYPGEGTYCVIKFLSGTNFRDSVIYPVQLSVYTDNFTTTKTLLDTFTKAYSNIPFVDGLDYCQQMYSTPFVLSPFQQAGIAYTTNMIISATLIVSSNVADIKTVSIDGTVYETSGRVLSYAVVPDNQRSSATGFINSTYVRMAVSKFSCSMIPKNNPFCTKLRRMRTGLLDIDTPFTIVLTFTDNDITETYTMKLDSQSINGENQSLPALSLSFIQ
ncbi:MAG: hypothetical protein WCX48_12135 [Bacteroidales bacterium]